MSRRRTPPKNPDFAYSKVQELMASPTEPLDPTQRTHHLLRVYRGLYQLEEADQPTLDDWQACSEAIHVTSALIELGVATDSTGLLDAAAHALADVARFGSEGGSGRLDGAGRAAVREIVDCYADMLGQIPARTVISAHRHSERRLRERLSAAKTRAAVAVAAELV